MGAWGTLAFDNDTACDWVYDLEAVHDLSLVESALNQVMTTTDEYLDSEDACGALAVCEVIALLRNQPGDKNSHTDSVDAWVAGHPLVPSVELLALASAAIDRILGGDSELRELWDEADGDEWRGGLEDLRRRLFA
jgi:hypothetical protein